MPKTLLLIGLTLLAGAAAAQTVPAVPAPGTPATPAPAAEKSPWLIFDQPLDSVAETPRRRAPREKAVRRAPAPGGARRTAQVSRNGFEATQGATYVPLDPDIYRLIDRYAIKFGSDSLRDPHTSVRPYTRTAAAHLGERMLGPDSAQATRSGSLSRADRFNAQYLLKDNWANSAQGNDLNQSARPFLNYFYRDQTDFYHVDSKDFTLRVNPVALLSVGKDNQNSDGIRYVNTRGAQIEGTIDQRLGFYAFLTDNQERVPLYVQNRIARDTIVPHEGYWKPFKTGAGQYDFFSARGYLTYAATKHINVQLGHDRNFIGNGYRSLILSDYSTPYFFLKLNTRVWKLNYQNLFAELTGRRTYNSAGSPVDGVYPKKYLALHHLSLDVTSNLNIGVFESEIAGGPGRGLELQYLNPIIFYRAVEQQVGSADNAILGLDFKWNIFHTAQLYGQLVLDEFKIGEVRARNGWWGNKQAFQLGGKYIDVAGVRNLDLQVEFNYIRPYTYQHEDYYTAYTHYMQPLAHPMGANLAEILGVLSYQPLPRLMLVGKAFYSEQGLDLTNADLTGANYGGNVLKSYNTRVSEYGNRTAQGNKSRLLHADFTATYQPRLNLFLDAKLIARHQTYSLTPALDGNEVYASLALRWNIAQRLHEF
ncbi:capsule assembly Wzi family protein [Hymenobacter properus]|uniref:Capsule assembly Wzi family protein n=1 Tax=Hymenobacter properus TaxID=2791026 RepID=A0A931BJA6_9BACT|nr:capsule assembly Wzi family protein [Hymenobacter properus]MBF9142387.1 hypothetical protein [Hymenobacter properus]MBR7721194.1 hypothetical protein [Microvirga sp. SRT04]